MLIVTVMSVAVLGIKVGIAIVSVVGLTIAINWFCKKTPSIKKGGAIIEGASDSERFNRHDIM